MKTLKNLILVAVILLTSTTASAVSAPRVPDNCEILRCTCYLPTGNTTADGTIPYEGICASNKEHLGQVAVLYTMDLEFIGYFECRDTGGHEGLKDGSRIDIYRDTKQDTNDWIKEYGDYVIVQWVKGEG